MSQIEKRIKKVEDSVREQEIRRLTLEENKLFDEFRKGPDKVQTMKNFLSVFNKRIALMRQSQNGRAHDFVEMQKQTLEKVLSIFPKDYREKVLRRIIQLSKQRESPKAMDGPC